MQIFVTNFGPRYLWKAKLFKKDGKWGTNLEPIWLAKFKYIPTDIHSSGLQHSLCLFNTFLDYNKT